MSLLTHVGVLANPQRPQTVPVARRVAATLAQAGVAHWQRDTWDEALLGPLCATTTLLVVVGGDGTVLRATRAAAPHGVPVLGVNMGYLGFLPEVEDAAAWDAALVQRLLGGAYRVETRMMVHAQVWRAAQCIAEQHALNDIVIGHSGTLGTVLLQTYIDRDWTTTYHADALIVATATGSTAYALASGGPILPPELRNILIVPVASHLSMDRALVVSEGAVVDVIVGHERGGAVVVADGASFATLEPDDRVTVVASDLVARFVRLRPPNAFYRALLDRMEPRLLVRNAPDRLTLNG